MVAMQNFPGMGAGTPQMPSGDPALPSALIGAYAAQQVADMLTQAQSTSILTGQVQQIMGDTLSKTVKTLMDAAMEEIQKASTNQPTVRAVASRALANHPAMKATPNQTVPASGPSLPSDNQPSHPQPSGGVPEGGAPRSTHTPTLKESYTEGYQGMQHATMGSVTKQAAGQVSRYIQTHGSHWLTDDATGDLVRYDNTGAEVDRMARGSDRFNGSEGNSARRGAFLTSTLARAASGEGIAGSLGRIGAMATRFAGPIGIGVAGVQMAGHFLESQNQKAATYRQSFGQQGTGMFAASDRLGEFVAGLGGFGSIGGDRARDEYEQASALGLRGDQRDNARDFSRDMYMKFGMDTAQSMQIVQQSIETGNASLDDFAKAIGEVSKSAVDAGRSSQQAVQDFVAAQKLIGTQVTSGSASTAIASNLSRITTGMSQDTAQALGGAQGLAQSMLGSPQSINMLAGIQGINPMAAQYAMQAGGATATNMGNQLVAGGAEAVIAHVAATIGMTASDMKQQARSRATRAPSGAMIMSDEDENQLLLQWGRGQTGAGTLLNVIATTMATIGRVTVASSEVRHVFFQMLLGTFGRGIDQKGYSTQDAISGHKIGAGLSDSVTAAAGVRQGQQISYRAADPTSAQGGRNAAAVMSGLGYGATDQIHDIDSVNAYISQIDKRGSSGASKAIEALLSEKGEARLKKETGEYSNDAQFVVQTPDGAKKVSMNEVMTNPAYRKQISTGDLKYMTESGAMHSISEITGVRTKGGNVGGSNAGGGAVGGGAVRVEFTGKAKEFFKVADGPTDSQRAGVPASGEPPVAAFSAGGQ